MSETVRVMPTSPERVWAVLADPSAYARWVVGADTIRDADPNWPAPGTRFHHRVGWGPIKVNDHTEVLEADTSRHLKLRAKVRPLGTATVQLDLQAQGNGTRVTMIEEAGDPLTRLVFNPLTHLLVHGRNTESLRRLEELALART
jgi:uncharacterized protein YndB with AHSA1/START domain